MKIYWKFQCPLGHATKRGWFGDTGSKSMAVWCPQCQVKKRHMPVHRKIPVKNRDGDKNSDGNEVANCDAKEAYNQSDDDTTSFESDNNIKMVSMKMDHQKCIIGGKYWNRKKLMCPSVAGTVMCVCAEESGDGTVQIQDDADVKIEDDFEVLSVMNNSYIMS